MASQSNPLPKDIILEQPTPLPLTTKEGIFDRIHYANSKQLQAILRRRERLKRILAPEERLVEVRKRFLKRSRMRVSNMRPRGEGGRFISQKEAESSSAANEGSNTPDAGPSNASGSSNHASISSGVGKETTESTMG